MKFKVQKGCTLYNTLEALIKKSMDCSKAARKLAKKYGATDIFTTGQRHRAGGIDAFRFEWGKDPDPALWRQVDKKNEPRAFMPRWGKKFSANATIWKEIEELPTISYEEWNKTIGFKPSFGMDSSEQGFAHYKSFGLGVHFKKGYALVVLHNNAEYKPKPGMTEILESEFVRLDKEIREQEQKMKV